MGTSFEVEIFEGFKAFFDARDARFLRARIELQFVFESKSGLKSMLFQLGRDWSTE